MFPYKDLVVTCKIHPYTLQAAKQMCRSKVHVHGGRTQSHGSTTLDHDPGYSEPTLDHDPGYSEPTLDHDPGYNEPTLDHDPGYSEPTLDHNPGYSEPT